MMLFCQVKFMSVSPTAAFTAVIIHIMACLPELHRKTSSNSYKTSNKRPIAKFKTVLKSFPLNIQTNFARFIIVLESTAAFDSRVSGLTDVIPVKFL